MFQRLIASVQDIEANLYCLSSAQEAVPISDNQYLRKLFSGDIVGQLPATGRHRVRRAAINLIGMKSFTYPAADRAFVFSRQLRLVVHNTDRFDSTSGRSESRRDRIRGAVVVFTSCGCPAEVM